MTVIIIFMADERYVRCNLFTRRRSRRVKRILTTIAAAFRISKESSCKK